MEKLLFVVVEKSDAGESVLGVFSTLEGARAVLPPVSSGRLEDYRVEGHVLDEGPDARPWQIAVDREGSLVSAEPAIFCNCEDDDHHFHANSFIEAGGGRLNVVVTAPSPGRAVEAAKEYARWLQETGTWGDVETAVEPIAVGD